MYDLFSRPRPASVSSEPLASLRRGTRELQCYSFFVRRPSHSVSLCEGGELAPSKRLTCFFSPTFITFLILLFLYVSLFIIIFFFFVNHRWQHFAVFSVCTFFFLSRCCLVFQSHRVGTQRGTSSVSFKGIFFFFPNLNPQQLLGVHFKIGLIMNLPLDMGPCVLLYT